MTSYYLAARFSRRFELQGFRADLLRIGHSVTSRWIDQRDDSDEPNCAARDIEDIDTADVLILFTEAPRCPTRGGRLVEYGIALGQRKPAIVIGPAENVFIDLPEVKRFSGWSDALQALKAAT
jgi:hypothetical protein